MAGESRLQPQSAAARDTVGFVDQRPWGFFQVLAQGKGFQVKLLVVRPGEAMSLQRHQHRNEFWVVVQGSARISKGPETLMMGPNETVLIPKGVEHRIEVEAGAAEVQVIEVQTGATIDESDIVRLQDKYGRATSAR